MATLLHPLAALVFCNFRFASFFERAHSGFPDLRAGFNHLMSCGATHFFCCSTDIKCIAEGAVGAALGQMSQWTIHIESRKLLLLRIKRHPPDCVAATTEHTGFFV
jgi:hypothetical protein